MGSFSYKFQFGQYYSLVMTVIIEEHTIIYGKIGYATFLKYLALIGKNDGAVDTIVRRFKEVVQGTVLRVVLTGFHFYWQYIQLAMVVNKEIYFTFLLVVVIMELK